jgi:hypothetical protein
MIALRRFQAVLLTALVMEARWRRNAATIGPIAATRDASFFRTERKTLVNFVEGEA